MCLINNISPDCSMTSSALEFTDLNPKFCIGSKYLWCTKWYPNLGSSSWYIRELQSEDTWRAPSWKRIVCCIWLQCSLYYHLSKTHTHTLSYHSQVHTGKIKEARIIQISVSYRIFYGSLGKTLNFGNSNEYFPLSFIINLLRENCFEWLKCFFSAFCPPWDKRLFTI